MVCAFHIKLCCIKYVGLHFLLAAPNRIAKMMLVSKQVFQTIRQCMFTLFFRISTFVFKCEVSAKT